MLLYSNLKGELKLISCRQKQQDARAAAIRTQQIQPFSFENCLKMSVLVCIWGPICIKEHTKDHMNNVQQQQPGELLLLWFLLYDLCLNECDFLATLCVCECVCFCCH